MFKVIATSLSVVIFAAFSASSAAAATKTVDEKPTVNSIERGDKVHFDDKKCPAGQIAEFRRARGGVNISRKCVNL